MGDHPARVYPSGLFSIRKLTYASQHLIVVFEVSTGWSHNKSFEEQTSLVIF
jgi:hypothetical protein